MGVLNLTPDSFSDGARYQLESADAFQVDLAKALAQVDAMVAGGAGIIDVGGESTRPGADKVSLEEELTRVIPVIELIEQHHDVLISVDTSRAEVMKRAILAGADIVNDVRALSDPGCLDLIKAEGVAVCLMHMQGEPGTMQSSYHYTNVVSDVYDFLEQRLEYCIASGIAKDQLIVDPGFGFGKSTQHNFQLLNHLGDFLHLGRPVLIGVSRKSMLGNVTGRPVGERLAASVAAATLALQRGAKIVRAHDVADTVDAIKVHCVTENPELVT
ncbi:MAG: dihydropteroate synthase [Pseudohongiella sp.]|nr:MAG: dihydropteroate synthase [Pseudohongiella sp.]